MNDADETHIASLETALNSSDAFAAAYALALQLRDAGMVQDRLLGIFEAVRARHENDADQRRFDAVVDVMDYIVGWCSPDKDLYPQVPEETRPDGGSA